MDREEMKNRLLKSEFAANNGRMIRTINVLRGNFVNLYSIEEALKSYIDRASFEESLIYLYKSCYIEIRKKENGKTISSLEKLYYKNLEVSLTQKGIKLAKGYIADEAVDV